MSTYPRGSEWRKWDLHVHAPGTKLSDSYKTNDGEDPLRRFCQIIHDSDVATVAVADYFSLDSYFAVKEKFSEMYPDSNTLILPNLELRLSVAVNRAEQEVNLHLIFRQSLTRKEADNFLGRLKTTGTTGTSRTAINCADLKTPSDFESATVSLNAINEAITDTFGEHATVPSIRQEHLLVIASAKGDGIRPGGSGIQRKKLLTDEIDKFSDAFFANIGSRDYFLGVDRLESDDLISSKPVFDGCDAHTFDQLTQGLGQHVTTDGRQRNITWIKADPTYAGLLQTLIEPADRVALQASEPDRKEPYKVISKVSFSGTDAFPSEVLLNRNLNSIIGSRSSGKSALLAFISHAVDAAETTRIQAETSGVGEHKVGPAAGFTWTDVSDVACTVEWESGVGTSGKVIYIPQNSLYSLSEQPDEITKKIAPALFRSYPTVKTAFDNTSGKIAAANTEIKAAVDEWFTLADRIGHRSQEIKDFGDKDAITKRRDKLQQDISEIKAAAQLTHDEVTHYQAIAAQLDAKEARLKEIAVELDQLSSFVTPSGEGTAPKIIARTVEATLTVRPSSVEVPDAVATEIEERKLDAVRTLVDNVEKTLVDATTVREAERAKLTSDVEAIRRDNAELIASHEANEELTAVVAEHKKQITALEEIAKRETSRDKLIADQEAVAFKIETGISNRADALTTLESTFEAEDRVLADLKFGIETSVTPAAVAHASIGFSRRSINDYIKTKGDEVDYEEAQSNPSKFLRALRDGKVRLNKDYEPGRTATEILTITKEIRFSAELDSDIIGGFARSSMTPGKQALFALTLILNESQEPWPLLIDQPEDDLDSRSIYETIVPYLIERKKERQIIMVSHNANLVIGSDSEQVIVANRHGVDRKNDGGRTFEYFTGALEHSQPLNTLSSTTLGRLGIREHACEILDGGQEAFEKRRNKYKF
ncbi:TrlF family AAA-like ATPase [Brevibacterium casei]|uniref:TrlF family AAA-like ATPase n=1 Tax=Brevibacterium casei TaxID=33889 RepID=UPI00314534BA